MQTEAHQRRRWLVLGLLIWSIVGLIGFALVVFADRYRQADRYPGATQIADHSLYTWTPSLSLRLDTSYRTQDEFPDVYYWYSHKFSLGPEVSAQSACITMEKSDAWLILENQMSVMVCDTIHGRMMFVMRAVALRYR